MNDKLTIPSCHNLIKINTEPDIQRIFSLTKSAYQAKYPESKLTDEDIFSFLQVHGLIPSSVVIDGLDTERLELCFSIITEYKCNSICQLCTYSALYKNTYELEESRILCFALQSQENLKFLIESGLSFKTFRAVIPLPKSTKLPTIPLHRLAFEYLECVQDHSFDLTTIQAICNVLKEKNKSKILVADIKFINNYLENLFRSHPPTQNEVQDILLNCFHVKKQPKPLTEQPSTTKILSGFLNGMEKPKAKVPPVEPAVSQTKPPSKTPAALPANDSIKAKDITRKDSASAPALPPTPSSTTYTKQSSKPKEKKTKFPPTTFCLDFNMKIGFPLVRIEEMKNVQLDIFQNDLLLTPLLPLEIVIGSDNQEYGLLFANKKFYYFRTTYKDIWSILFRLLSQSNYRHFLCYEPYRLYELLNNWNIHFSKVFSLSVSAAFLYNQVISSPTILYKLLETSWPHQHSDIFFLLPDYRRLYNTLYKQLTNLEKTSYDTYTYHVSLAAFISRSFHLSKCFDAEPKLLSIKTICHDKIYEFNYSKKLSTPAHLLTLSFTIQTDIPESFPLLKFLYQVFLCSKTYVLFLVHFDVNKNHMIFTLHHDNYAAVCELINNVATFIAEEENILIHILESKENSIISI